MNTYRTHNCSELRAKDVDKQVKLSGWINRKRDHGNLLFIDLRDHYGITQCVIDISSDLFKILEKTRVESVITVIGKVISRGQEAINPNLDTGEIEIVIDELIVESSADVLPFPVAGDNELNEEMRLRYRYLDLRRESVHNNIILRSKVINILRNRMIDQGFLEVQTPILTASSPEGARDFLVASRLHPGKFYALPQAPQQFKQLLMCSGFDKYFQIAPCFRDEDARADRSPGEFYQLDFEMAYATQDDVFAIIEPVLYDLYKELGGEKKVSDLPFKRIPYRESMLKYGSDKPDLRNPLIINDVTEEFRGSGFGLFAGLIEKGNVVRAIPATGASSQPRRFYDKLNDWAREEGQGGLGYIIFEENGNAKGPIAKNLDEDRIAKIKEVCNLNNGDAVFFACGKELDASTFAGASRTRIANELGLIKDDSFEFCWIVDFPMFEEDDNGKIEFSHNPFSMPQGGMEALETMNPLDILAWQYDIVCNGIELSSGAIRNHKPEIMYKAFDMAGYTKETVDTEFGGMISAFKFGAPPHGGCAPGVDRMIMQLANEPNIREIIAFPMNQRAEDLMMNAPSEVADTQLRELHIKKSLPKKIEKKSD